MLKGEEKKEIVNRIFGTMQKAYRQALVSLAF